MGQLEWFARSRKIWLYISFQTSFVDRGQQKWVKSHMSRLVTLKNFNVKINICKTDKLKKSFGVGYLVINLFWKTMTKKWDETTD